jgi:hypothetical protein
MRETEAGESLAHRATDGGTDRIHTSPQAPRTDTRPPRFRPVGLGE